MQIYRFVKRIDSLPENTHIWTDIDLGNNHFDLHPAVMSTIFMGMIFEWSNISC